MNLEKLAVKFLTKVYREFLTLTNKLSVFLKNFCRTLPPTTRHSMWI